MTDVAIKVENLNKLFKLYPDLVRSRLKQFLLPHKRFYKEKYALKDINLSINKGEVVGVLGPNGAGKTTLLKMIAGISFPTSGTIKSHGKVVTVMALGLGFHPRLSGMENLQLAGMMLGMSRNQIKSKIDWIVDFSELGQYINQPITSYSTGMRARLSFAVAACQDPEILIIDEALATGDVRFVQKCINRIHEITLSGTTALFVSHNIWSIKRLTKRTLLLTNGTISADGETSVVADKYYELMLKNEEFCTPRKTSFDDFVGNGKVKLSHASLLDASHNDTNQLNPGDKVQVVLTLESLEAHPNVELMLTCRRSDGVTPFTLGALAGGNMDENGDFVNSIISLEAGKNIIKIEIPKLLLAPGDFYFDIQIFDSDNFSGFASNEQFYFKTHILDFCVRKYKNQNRSIIYYQPAKIWASSNEA